MPPRDKRMQSRRASVGGAATRTRMVWPTGVAAPGEAVALAAGNFTGWRRRPPAEKTSSACGYHKVLGVPRRSLQRRFHRSPSLEPKLPEFAGDLRDDPGMYD